MKSKTCRNYKVEHDNLSMEKSKSTHEENASHQSQSNTIFSYWKNHDTHTNL